MFWKKKERKEFLGLYPPLFQALHVQVWGGGDPAHWPPATRQQAWNNSLANNKYDIQANELVELVSDPHCFHQCGSGSGSSILGHCGSGTRTPRSETNRVETAKNCKKNVHMKIIYFFWSKTALSLGLHKGRPSYRVSAQPSKENTQHTKTKNFFTFSYYFLQALFALLDPDPDPQWGCGSSRPKSMHPRGSGSEGPKHWINRNKTFGHRNV